MKARAIIQDSEGHSEWCFGHSFGDYRQDRAQIIQDIYTALREWKYDCFFALQNGIDWYTRLGFKNQKELLDKDIQDVIKGRQGVLGLFNFESSVDGRHYTCSCKVYTEYSDKEIAIDFSM